VQYVCRAGDYRSAGFEYTGALEVLKVIMGYEYLWMKIRVKGGAYGCSIRFSKSGESVMTSYRDPNLDKTIEAFEAAAEYVRSFQEDERTITKYLIGAISNMDTPLTPSAEGTRSLSAYLSNITEEDLQKQRNQVLDITQKDINALAPLVEAIMNQEALCVIGNAKVIEKSKDKFHHIESLFR
jgi:Zn-dependent M16 (insulinase) family peptidase